MVRAVIRLKVNPAKKPKGRSHHSIRFDSDPGGLSGIKQLDLLKGFIAWTHNVNLGNGGGRRPLSGYRWFQPGFDPLRWQQGS